MTDDLPAPVAPTIAKNTIILIIITPVLLLPATSSISIMTLPNAVNQPKAAMNLSELNPVWGQI